VEAEIDSDNRKHNDHQNLGNKVEDIEASFVEVPRCTDGATFSIEHRCLRDPGDYASEELSSGQDCDSDQQNGDIDPEAAGAKLLNLVSWYKNRYQH
tara:strand:- start:23040 stop:23330 length:291 start_codon:yes stop_codon:yes gene_type:complete